MTKQISVILEDYIQELLGNTLDQRQVPDYVAHQLLELPDPLLFHLEIREPGRHELWQNNNWQIVEYSLPVYIVWRPSSWALSERRTTYRKTLSARERAVAHRRGELRAEFIRALRGKTGLDEDSASRMVDEMIATRVPTVALAFGLDMSELLKADAELQEFKRLTNTK